MDYLNVKAMNDALARFPHMLAELEHIADELAHAQTAKDGPAQALRYAATQIDRTKAQLETCRDQMTASYLSALPQSWPPGETTIPLSPAGRPPSTPCVKGKDNVTTV